MARSCSPSPILPFEVLPWASTSTPVFQGRGYHGVVALWETVFPDDPPHNAPSKVFAAKLTVKDDMLLVAVDEDAIVGTTMAGYDGFRGWLHNVAVLLGKDHMHRVNILEHYVMHWRAFVHMDRYKTL